MTNDQINTAIARKLGWKPTTDGGICWDADGNSIITPPDYCSDLNLCHEAEMLLSNDQRKELVSERERFRDELHRVMLADGHRDSNDRIHARAKQRALALCKTWGLDG